jgi:cobalt/nickel transport system permease protein
MAGTLFLRSIERSDRVYAAMLSRGYSGELPRAESKSLTTKEWQTILFGLCMLFLIWIVGMLTGGR